MTRFLRLLLDDWRKNYRYHGGSRALARCFYGDLELRRGGVLPAELVPAPQLDCTVFSVVPQMSALWAAMFERAVRIRPLRVLVGDCSGDLHGGTETCFVQPMLNVHHGEKLDLFFKHLVRADLVLVADDDVFWLDEEPLVWALERLASQPDVAVVSLTPKQSLTSVLRGKVERPMGPVVVVRRDVWVREGLSFRIVYPSPSEGYSWYYDTGEFAQVELGRRGYRVEFGPEHLRRHLVFFEGISSWTLRLQKYSGDLRPAIEEFPARQEKALRTILVLRGLGEVIGSLWGERTAPLVEPRILDRAQRICEEFLEAGRVSEIQEEVRVSLRRLRQRIAECDSEGVPLGASVRQMLGSHGV